MSERSRRAHADILAQLEGIDADFSLFTHRPIRDYEDAKLARQESGFSGAESKSMVLKSGDATFVYVTLAGRRVDFKAMRAHIGGLKPKILNDEELIEKMGAEPGSAFPFGFGPEIPIYVDPDVFAQEWILISPAIPTGTIQMHGSDLQKIYAIIGNRIEEVTTFNQPMAPAD